MDKNPILSNYKAKLLYTGIWVLIIGIKIFSLGHSWGPVVPIEYVVADTITFNTLFALCLLPVWYPVRFTGWERKTWQFNLMAHLLLSAMYVAICLSIGSFIIWLFASDNSDYMRFLNISQWWNIVSGFSFYLVAVLIYYLAMYIERLNEKAKNEIRLNQLVKDSELNLLKSQISPHFLFNSLNSVNSLIVQNPEQAQKMLVALSDYLRYAVLSSNKIYSSLQEEIENIERYLSIEKLRFGEKLIYHPVIDEHCLPLKIPAMLLQPLFENAIKHGVYESLQTVHIDVEINRTDSFLIIVISNDYATDAVSQKKKGSETGLKNSRERLRLSYGDEASLRTKLDNGKFIATLIIPVE